MRGLLVACLLAGCASSRPQIRDPGAAARGRELALAAARAHGGLGKWLTQRGVTLAIKARNYPLSIYPEEGQYLLDPLRNRALVRFWKKGVPFEWRYDGKRAVVVRRGVCETGALRERLVAGLLSNLLFWYGVPFKFLDEGAMVEDAGPGPDGMPRILVTYRGVGETPDDWFLVSLDRETHLVRRIVYVASAISKRLEFQGVWRDYKTHDGMALATRRLFGPRNGRPERASVLELTLLGSNIPLDDSYFAPPPDCD